MQQQDHGSESRSMALQWLNLFYFFRIYFSNCLRCVHSFDVISNIKYYLFLSVWAGAILEILQSDWFRERANLSDLARSRYDSARSRIHGKLEVKLFCSAQRNVKFLPLKLNLSLANRKVKEKNQQWNKRPGYSPKNASSPVFFLTKTLQACFN